MTQPAAEQPRRIPLDELTSDALDQLYARLATAEREADEAITAAAHLTRLVGKRSEKAERNAKRQHLRADLAETELRTLRAGLRANGADPTQIQNLWAQIHLRNRQWRDEKRRAERAEAAIERVRAYADQLCVEPHPSHDHECPDDIRKGIRAALDEQQEQT